MAVTSLILGILAFLLSIIPAVGVIALVPAIIAFILGIVALGRKTAQNKSKAMQVAGVILSSISLAIAIFWLSAITFLAIIPYSFDRYDDIDDRYEQHSTIPTYQLNEDNDLGEVVVKIERTTLDNDNEKVVKAKEGYQYVAFKVHIKNISYYDIYSYEHLTQLMGSNGITYGTDYNKVYSNTTFNNEVIEPGKVVTGMIAFEIPESVKEKTILFNTSEDVFEFNIP